MHFLFLARSGNESRTSSEVTTDLGTTFSLLVSSICDILSNLFLALRNGILNIYSISFFAQPRTNGKNRGKINFPRLFLFRHIPRKGSNYRDEISIKIKFNDCTRNKSNFSFPLLLRASYKCALFLLFFLLFLRVPFFPPFPFREFVS